MLTEPTFYTHYSHVPSDLWRWPNFTPREIACKGTGAILINPRAMDMLQALRERLGRPLIVHSGYRSPEHNRRVGGAQRSKHMEGIAFDISMANHEPSQVIAEAKALEFKGIGTYPRQNFLHVDARLTDAAWGDPFPESRAPFSEEPPRPRENLSGSRTLKGGAVAGVGTLGTAVLPEASTVDSILEAVTDAQTEVQQLLPMIDGLRWVFIALALAGIALTIYARIDDHRQGRR